MHLRWPAACWNVPTTRQHVVFCWNFGCRIFLKEFFLCGYHHSLNPTGLGPNSVDIVRCYFSTPAEQITPLRFCCLLQDWWLPNTISCLIIGTIGYAWRNIHTVVSENSGTTLANVMLVFFSKRTLNYPHFCITSRAVCNFIYFC